MKKLKIGLLGKILIAIALGIGVGLIAQPWMVRTMLTFNGIFSEFLGFAIPLIILGLVTPAISDIGKTAGKMLLITVAIAYGSTVLSGLLSVPGFHDGSVLVRTDILRQSGSLVSG